MPPPPPLISSRDRLIGVGSAILCSIGLGLAVAFGRTAFDGGATPLLLALCRAGFSIGFMASVCVLMGQSLRLPWPLVPHLLFLGLLFSHMAFGNVGATKYIPVSLAALLFFVYPPVVALINAVLERQPPSILKCCAMATAFGGLAVMLGVEFATYDPRGVVMGLTAGLACAVNIVWLTRRVRGLHPLVIVFYQSCVALVVTGALAFQLDQLQWPHVSSGWWALGLVVVLQSCSIPLYYVSIQRIGPEPAAMLNNFQPVASIAAAILLFNETLTGDRMIGAAMVVGGILLIQWSDRRMRRRIQDESVRKAARDAESEAGPETGPKPGAKP